MIGIVENVENLNLAHYGPFLTGDFISLSK